MTTNKNAAPTLSALRDPIADRMAALNKAIDAAIANPTPAAYDELRTATERVMRAMAQLLIAIGRLQGGG